MADIQRIQELYRRLLTATATEKELQELYFLADQLENEGIFQEMFAGSWNELEQTDQGVQAFLKERAERASLKPVLRPPAFFNRNRWTAAAVFILLFAGAYFMISRRKEKPALATASPKTDVLPGHNGATLRLSNGSTVVLDSVQDGRVATQGLVQAIKVNGALKYTGHANDEVVYNEVTTGRGRQWQLILPDGTKVWLNASSSIHYPLAFTAKERVVEMTGEVYFEVKHNSKQPFKVKVGDQVINDIGTSFNVNAYTDEPAFKTTLVEGTVSVNGKMLKPGQQAVNANNKIMVSAADISQTLAWKNGQFIFDGADIGTVMRQISRWYDVDVNYQENITNHFTGIISRNVNASQVFSMLEMTGAVHFKIENKSVIVMH